MMLHCTQDSVLGALNTTNEKESSEIWDADITQACKAEAPRVYT